MRRGNAEEKGAVWMQHKIVEKDSFKVLGIRMVTQDGGGTWGVVKSDGSMEKIEKICGKGFDLGLCFGFDESGANDYMCAVEWDGGENEGFETYVYPPASWLVFRAQGRISENVLGNMWYEINQDFLPQSQYGKCGLPTIEKYLQWDEAGDICDMEVWIPVKG